MYVNVFVGIWLLIRSEVISGVMLEIAGNPVKISKAILNGGQLEIDAYFWRILASSGGLVTQMWGGCLLRCLLL